MKWKEADDRASQSLGRRQKARAAHMPAWPRGSEGGARVQKRMMLCNKSRRVVLTYAGCNSRAPNRQKTFAPRGSEHERLRGFRSQCDRDCVINLPRDVSAVSVRGVDNLKTNVLYLFGQ